MRREAFAVYPRARLGFTQHKRPCCHVWQDTTRPDVQLVGDPAMVVEAATQFRDPGVRAYDVTGAPVIHVTGAPNMRLLGSYTMTSVGLVECSGDLGPGGSLWS